MAVPTGAAKRERMGDGCMSDTDQGKGTEKTARRRGKGMSAPAERPTGAAAINPVRV